MADFKISDFLKMQDVLAKEKGWMSDRVPSRGHMSILWSIDELGEAIAIIKKKGWENIMENPAVRAHYVEECADVFMYMFDMFNSYGITGEEFSDAYLAKFERNMGRRWDENSSLYENIGYKLAIFDLDGTLIDSSAAFKKSVMDTLSEYGVNAKLEDFDYYKGRGDDLYIGKVAEKYGCAYTPDMKEKAYVKYSENRDMVNVYPWTQRMLEVVAHTDTKIAVASSADDTKVKINLDIINTDGVKFDTVITGSMASEKKPSPMIFILAAEKAGVNPADCIVFEDAVCGVEAAKRAGMKCAAVTTSFSKEELINAGADMVFDDLMDFFKHKR